MHEQGLFCIQSVGEGQRLLKRVKRAAGDVISRIFKPVPEPRFKYPGLDYEKISIMNFRPVFREWLDIARGVNNLGIIFLKNINERCLGAPVNRNSETKANALSKTIISL